MCLSSPLKHISTRLYTTKGKAHQLQHKGIRVLWERRKRNNKRKKKTTQPACRISYLAVIILSARSKMELCQILLAGGPCCSILLVQSICEIRSVILKR